MLPQRNTIDAQVRYSPLMAMQVKYTQQARNRFYAPSQVTLFSSLGLPTSPESDPASSEVPANVQLPVVGVSSPSCALWNSPKSPKLESNDESSISSEKEGGNVNGSEPLAACESENGPNPSYMTFTKGL